MMTSTPLINLSDEQKEQLTGLAQTGPDLLSHRARLILAYAEGMPTLQASNAAGISRGRARFWKRQFISRGMRIFESEDEGNTADYDSAEEQTGTIELREKDAVKIELEIPGEQELSFPQPTENVGITVTDTLAEAGRKVWLFHFADMLSHEEGTLKGEDVEQLHDMRVATRRMRTAFDVFGSAFEAKTLRRHLKGLKGIGRVLGGVRDMDVILENAINYQRKQKESVQAGLAPLLAEWRETIARQREKMLEHLQSEEYREFKSSFNQFLQPEEPGILDVTGYGVQNPLIRDSVPALVYSRYAAVRGYEAIVPRASVLELHALRIEFKKFRYTLEYFKEVLGGGIEQAISEIKQLQDHLGELHDADVACQLVRTFLKESERTEVRLAISERQNPKPTVDYLAYLYAERYRLMRTFPEQWNKFSRLEFRHIIAEAITLL